MFSRGLNDQVNVGAVHASFGIVFFYLYVDITQNNNFNMPGLPDPNFWGSYICQVQPSKI